MAKVFQTNDGFAKILSGMTGRFQTWQLWADFVQLSSMAISQTVDYREEREDAYMAIAQKYTADEITNFSKLLALVAQAYEKDRDQDYLGSLYMGLDLGSHWHGQFFTPYSVCAAMASLTAFGTAIEEINNNGYILLNDCACGAGATLIAGTNAICKALIDSGSPLNYQNHVLVVAQDIDPITASMCYIQLSLLGIAAVVKIGDSICDPFTGNALFYRKEANLWYTPYWFSSVWEGRRMARQMDIVLKSYDTGSSRICSEKINLSDLI